MRRFVGLAALAVVLSAAPASAAVVFLNFDVDFNGNPLAGGTLLNAAYPSPDFTFGADDAVRAGGGGVRSQPNFATGNPVDFTSPLDLTIVFPNLANSISAFNVTNSSYTLTAYDAANNPLGSQSCATFLCETVVNFPNQIARVQFTTDFQYGIDDLTIDYTAVPEPVSLFLVSSGLVGMAVRRRRTLGRQ